jgi:hypothetical protein
MLKVHVKNQHVRSDIPRELGRQKMALSASRAGQPSDNSKPPVMPDFVAKKIKDSTQHDCE